MLQSIKQPCLLIINQSIKWILFALHSYPCIPCGSSKSVLCFFTGLHRVLQELFSWVYTHHHLDKSAWSDDSWFLLWHSDGIVKFFCKQHGSMLAGINGSGSCWWNNCVGNIFWQTLAAIQHCLNATTCLSTAANMSITLWLQRTHHLVVCNCSSRITY